MILFTILMVLIQTIMCDHDRRVITTLKYSKFSVMPTIVNGYPAHEGQIPYVVSIKEARHKLEPATSVWQNLCGGSIINAFSVVSAAHCFELNAFFYAKFPEILSVVAGDLKNEIVHSGISETTSRMEWRRIEKVILHSEFSFPTNDIALVYVTDPWIFTHLIQPINIARKTLDYGNDCFASGYGRTGEELNDTVSPVLLTADVKPMPKWKCSVLWGMNMNSFICTDSALSDVARGDSGGPLTCFRTGDPNEKQDFGILVGVVSGKNYDKTTLFTRVSEYDDWIDRGCAEVLSPNVYLPIILFILIYVSLSCAV